MSLDVSSSLPQPGAVFGPYRLEAILGRGGMGAVYRARHSETGAVHALKLVLLAHQPGMEHFLGERFQREVEVLARIEGHPGLVRVFTSGEEAGIPWYAMELVDGVPLSEELKSQLMSPRRAATLVVEMARAVAHAHRCGVVHRDLKPANILVDSDGRAHVADFGLAHDACSPRLTQTGEILGTPQFMAPEQVEADAASEFGGIGPATDVYGLGAVLYACLTGQPPLGRKPARELMIDIVTKDPAAPSTQVPGMPLDLDAICLRALARKPERRYRSADALADDLERWLRDEPVLARRVGTLETLWRRYRPRSRAGRWATVGLAVALGGVMSVGLFISYQALFWDPRLARRLEKLEFTQTGPGGLDAAGRRELEDLSQLVADFGEPGDATRLEVIRQLEKVTSNVPGRRQQAIERLAELVEETGEANERLLKQVCSVLRREERFDDLVRLFYGSKPLSQRPKPLVAKDMAWALARAGVTLELPYDQEAFDYLYRAARDKDKPRLLRRRLDQMLARQDWALSLAAALKMRHAHGVVVDASEWPAAFVKFIQEAFADLVTADVSQLGTAEYRVTKLQNLQFYMDLLARTPVPLLPVDRNLFWRIGEPITQAVFSFTESREKDEVLSAEALESLIFLEMRGASPFKPSLYRVMMSRFPSQQIMKLGNKEAAKPRQIRNPLRCLVLARLLLSVPLKATAMGQSMPEGGKLKWARQWLDAASEVNLVDARTGGAPRWQCVMEAHVYDLLNGRDKWDHRKSNARAAWLEALQGDRVRSVAQRWPRLIWDVLFPECRLLLQGVDSELFSEAVAVGEWSAEERLQWLASLGLEFVEVSVAAWEHWGMSNQGGQLDIEPWALVGPRLAANTIILLGRKIFSSNGDECCNASWQTSSGRLVLEDLLDQALTLVVTNEAPDGHAASAQLLLLRARHHQRHGRLTSALDDLDEGLSRARQMERRNVERKRLRLEVRWQGYELRAQVLRGLGRDSEAIADDQARQALAVPMYQIQARDYLDRGFSDLALKAIRAGLDSARQLEASDAGTGRKRLERLRELYKLRAEAQHMAGREDEARVAEQKALRLLDKLENLR